MAANINSLILRRSLVVMVLFSIGISNVFPQESDDLLESAIKRFGATPKMEERKLGMDAAMDVERVERAHAKVFENDQYPSASKCAECHQQIYEEWSVSNHAYASLSPMFHKFEQKITELSMGTIGYFCLRCHAGVGTTIGEPREMVPWKKAKVSNEGITCISCHRVDEEYSKVNGERRIVPGPLYDPVYGNIGGTGVAEVIANKAQTRVKTTPEGKGMDIHRAGIRFKQLSKSEFCLSCHQVAVHPGIKLEVVWDQYRSSPSLSKGTSCQDCHMGKNPGRADGYATGPAAIVGGKAIHPERQHSNHAMWGPGYPISHPGVFPHHPKADRFSMEDWLKFDWRAGWGKAEFEDKVKEGSVKATFPDAWKDVEDRFLGREVIEENLIKLDAKKEMRRRVMENGSHIDGPFFAASPVLGKKIRFHYDITNTNPGHNMPSGSLGAQPEIWLNVSLTDSKGKVLWESGYVDEHGDMCDLHSLGVRAGKIPRDAQLFNLQTKFLTTNLKGTEREMYLPINLDFDQLPFIRPSGVPTSVLNHPPFVRMEQRSIPPLHTRKAEYSVPAKLIEKPGTYRLSVRLRSRAEPIYFMKFCGATPEMERSMNEWMLDLHPYSVEFQVKGISK